MEILTSLSNISGPIKGFMQNGRRADQTSFLYCKKMDAKLPQLFFDYLSRTPYGVEPVPHIIAPKYTTGRYVSPSTDK